MTDDWMDDGEALGSMDSEDEADATKSEEKHVEESPKSEEKTKPSGIDLPITEMTDDWMDDDVAIGSIDSEDEDIGTTNTKQEGIHQTNLALPQPSYASIASHEVTQAAREPELPTTDEVVVLKPGKSLPLVVNVEEKTDSDEDLKDSEGFEEVTTRKLKRERKHSKRVSLCDDEPYADNEAKQSEDTTKSEEKHVEEPPKHQKASGIALPITEMTDDWMDDGEALGSMDSEDEAD